MVLIYNEAIRAQLSVHTRSADTCIRAIAFTSRNGACCLDDLRTTSQVVFKSLEAWIVNASYFLELTRFSECCKDQSSASENF